MKRLIPSIISALFIILFIVGCSKDLSFETGLVYSGTASGSLKDSNGNCLNVVVKGQYIVDSSLKDSNYLLIQAEFSTTGKYKIFTDTVNGMWFLDSGFITNTGMQILKVRGYGKPILPVEAEFTVQLAGTFCFVKVQCSGTGSATSPTEDDYFPTNVGNNWGYDDSYASDTVGIISTNINATDPETNKTYRVFASSDGDTSYYRKTTGNYFEYALIADSSKPKEFRFLTDTANAGYIWYSDTVHTVFQGNAAVARIKFTIMSKNTSASYNGVIVNNVIKVQRNYEYNLGSGFQSLLTGNFYYAKGIGLINIEFPNINPPYYFTIRRWKLY